MGDIVYHWEEAGTGDTPLATRALHVEAVLDIVKESDNTKHLDVQLTTYNYAVTDVGTGAVQISFRNDKSETGSYIVKCPQNPARGFGGPTQRNASQTFTLTNGLEFNQIAFRFFNDDNPGPAIDFMPIVDLAEKIIVAML